MGLFFLNELNLNNQIHLRFMSFPRFSNVYTVLTIAVLVSCLPRCAQANPAFDSIPYKDVAHHITQSEKNLETSNYPFALRHAQMARTMSVLENDEQRFNANFQLGRVCFYMGLFNNAAQSWLDALHIAKAIKNDSLTAKTLFNLAGLYIMLEDYNKAGTYLERAKPYFFPVDGNPIPPVTRLMFLNNEAIIAGKLGKRTKAHKIFKEGLLFARENGLHSVLQTITSAYITFLFDNNLYDDAEVLLYATIADSSNLSRVAVATYFYKLGDVYKSKQRVDKALINFNKSYAIAREVNDITLQKKSAENLSKIHDERSNTERSLAFQKTADSLKSIERQHEAEKSLLINHYNEQFEAYQNMGKLREWFIIVVAFVVVALLTIIYLLYVRSVKKKSIVQHKQALMAYNQQLIEERAHLKEMMAYQKQEFDVERRLIRNQAIIESLKHLVNSSEDDQEISAQVYDASKRQFDQETLAIDPGFYQRLQNIGVKLTANEKRLCGYLYHNLSSKEISLLTGQTLRAVEMARIRLRKKLKLKKGDNLSAFMHSV